MTPRSGDPGLGRRSFLLRTALALGAAAAPRALLGDPGLRRRRPGKGTDACLRTKELVPDPEDVVFRVSYRGGAPLRLVGHFWHDRTSVRGGRKCPAIVELNPYRRRDGMIAVDSAIYPWFAYNGYLCFRVDLQGSGDSEGVLTDEYSDEELSYCVQVIEQVAMHPWCDGSVGMMGESWSAINSLMVAARPDCPSALKAVLVNCGTDDRFSDDVHYMGGAMMQDNAGWAASMWGWLAQPPDPVVVGGRWRGMWRERIRKSGFWFGTWAAHQERDDYWSRTSVRDRWKDVKVPVLIMSGWQDGYKNPVDRVVRGLAAEGMPVAGMIGPWGHSYPFRGSPGPQVDWLPYAVTHWWDRWLKGSRPSPREEWPQLAAWLGRPRAPGISACYEDEGRWVAEDAGWPGRVRERVLYLAGGGRLWRDAPVAHAPCIGSDELLRATAMLETSSFGSCGNDDLPGDLTDSDALSLSFESEPLEEELDCFGYPEADLVLSCDRSIASVAVRLAEVDPESGEAHLVSYTFFNLCHRDGNAADPRPVEPGVPFRVKIPLNLLGHTFRAGWRIRLSVSPSFFPTMWQGVERASITLHAGAFGGLPASRLVLPGRDPRPEDERMRALFPPDAEVLCVDVDDYVPITTDPDRAGEMKRVVESFSEGGREGVRVLKTYDYGRCRYDGHLEGLWVDQVLHENFRVLDGDPLSVACTTSSETILERPRKGWKVRSETTATVWTDRDPDGQPRFRYRASVRAYEETGRWGWRLVERNDVEGAIPRKWV